MHPFLSWFEAWLVRRLIRSPRIGAIVVKQHGKPVTWYLSDPTDSNLYTDDLPPEGTIQACDHDFEEDAEPPSMLLERLYHAPDAKK